jgi:acetyl-CoA acetyltransferase
MSTVDRSLRDKAAVVGIGETEYSKDSGRTELALACEAISKAADDAGIPVSEIDGLVRYDMDSVDEVALTSHLGLKNLGWMSHTGYGGTGGNAVIVHAAAAIAAGLASTVVCYRALNERSGHRYGQASTWMQDAMSGFEAFQMPWGMLTPAHMFGQFARRHMIEYGTTSEQFGHVAVALRKHGSMNPRAMMRKPITLEDHQASRMIADPLHLLDCCIESDGACAVIVTAAERAKDTKHGPVWIMGAAQGSGTHAVGIVFRDDLATPESVNTARDVYRSAGVGPEEIDAVMIYDHFTPFIIFSLEAYGFCKPGEGGPFVEDGRIEFDGELPVNTHGGNHSEAYIHGLPHIIESVRQFRGTSSAQMPKDPDLILSCSSVAQLSAAVILRKDS